MAARHFLLPYTHRPSQGTIQPPLQWMSRLFPAVKRPERVVEHPTHLAPKLKMSGDIPLLPPPPTVPVQACSSVTFYLTVRDKLLYKNKLASNLNDMNCGKWKIKEFTIACVCDWLIWRKQTIYTECTIRKLSLRAWLMTGCPSLQRVETAAISFILLADDNVLLQTSWRAVSQASVVEDCVKNFDQQRGHPYWGLLCISSIPPKNEETVPGVSDNCLFPSICKYFTYPTEVLTAP